MKSIIALLLGFFKFPLLSKFFISLGSIAASLFVYGEIYGWQYGLGIVLLILCHELGHYIAAKQKNISVGLPIFIPFIGAGVELKEKPISVEVEAYVAFAGPYFGTLVSFLLYYWWRHSNFGLALALAKFGFIINLFNLIPLSPLDGGRITAIISPRVWLLGIPILIIAWLYLYSPLLILIAIISIPQIMKAWNFDPHLPENIAYYNLDASIKIEYTLLYLGLIIVLALMVNALP